MRQCVTFGHSFEEMIIYEQKNEKNEKEKMKNKKTERE